MDSTNSCELFQFLVIFYRTPTILRSVGPAFLCNRGPGRILTLPATKPTQRRQVHTFTLSLKLFYYSKNGAEIESVLLTLYFIIRFIRVLLVT